MGFPNALDNFEIIRFNRVRVVSEGPNSVRNAPYLLLRVIAVYDLDLSHPPSADAHETLLRLAGKGDRVVSASAAEISRGRSGRAIIGSQACLLYGTHECVMTQPPSVASWHFRRITTIIVNIS